MGRKKEGFSLTRKSSNVSQNGGHVIHRNFQDSNVSFSEKKKMKLTRIEINSICR